MYRTLMMAVVVMSLALGLAACQKKTVSEKASDTAKSAGDAVGDAAKSASDQASKAKDAAVKAAQDTYDALQKKWQDFQAKAAPTTDQAKADFRKAGDQMAQALRDAKAKLVEAKDAGADAWQKNVKPALDAALQKAQKLYEDASAKFSNS